MIIPSSKPFESSLKSLEKEITCSICFEIFNDPQTLVNCGHSFCKGCLDQWRASGPENAHRNNCPMCRQSIISTIRSPLLINIVKTTVNLKKSIKLLSPVVAEPPPEVITIYDEVTNVPNFANEVITID